jgi:hypothetical protein
MEWVIFTKHTLTACRGAVKLLRWFLSVVGWVEAEEQKRCLLKLGE